MGPYVRGYGAIAASTGAHALIGSYEPLFLVRIFPEWHMPNFSGSSRMSQRNACVSIGASRCSRRRARLLQPLSVLLRSHTLLRILAHFLFGGLTSTLLSGSSAASAPEPPGTLYGFGCVGVAPTGPAALFPGLFCAGVACVTLVLPVGFMLFCPIIFSLVKRRPIPYY